MVTAWREEVGEGKGTGVLPGGRVQSYLFKIDPMILL